MLSNTTNTGIDTGLFAPKGGIRSGQIKPGGKEESQQSKKVDQPETGATGLSWNGAGDNQALSTAAIEDLAVVSALGRSDNLATKPVLHSPTAQRLIGLASKAYESINVANFFEGIIARSKASAMFVLLSSELSPTEIDKIKSDVRVTRLEQLGESVRSTINATELEKVVVG